MGGGGGVEKSLISPTIVFTKASFEVKMRTNGPNDAMSKIIGLVSSLCQTNLYTINMMLIQAGENHRNLSIIIINLKKL